MLSGNQLGISLVQLLVERAEYFTAHRAKERAMASLFMLKMGPKTPFTNYWCVVRDFTKQLEIYESRQHNVPHVSVDLTENCKLMLPVHGFVHEHSKVGKKQSFALLVNNVVHFFVCSTVKETNEWIALFRLTGVPFDRTQTFRPTAKNIGFVNVKEERYMPIVTKAALFKSLNEPQLGL